MIAGIEASSIIVGADGDPRGGVCPVYAISSPPPKRIGRPFARAWDRYGRAHVARPASERELRTLRSMLETSVELETKPVVLLDSAIAEHKASQERSRVRAAVSPARKTRDRGPRRDTGERDRTRELSRRHGWAWMRPVRRFDDYERMLRELDGLEQEASPAAELERLVPSGAGRG